MTRISRWLAAIGLGVSGITAAGACDALRLILAAGAPAVDPAAPQIVGVSQARDNASRLINTAPGKELLFEVRQFTGAGTQTRCNPLGTGGADPWPSRIGGFKVFTPNLFNNPSEYDWVGTLGETEFCLGLRVPFEPFFPLQFSMVEFSLRAVNPCANGHLFVGPPGNDYHMTAAGGQADYPSNDDNPARRSLIDLEGGDVALIVVGIDFKGSPGSTVATMNFLGPTGWLVFMRDNAFQSGRFFDIAGALKGGPPAFFDTPGAADDGPFESVQVNGDEFDMHSEPFMNTSGFPSFLTCAGAPSEPYAFVDMSNRSEMLGAGPGQGGFVFVIRKSAFDGKGVVVNPNVPGPAPDSISLADLILPPPSGYNEPAVLPIVCPDEDDHSADGPGGVHEIGWSVFFIHGS